MALVDVLQHVEFETLLLRREAFAQQVLDGLLGDILGLHAGVADGRTLVGAGQKRGGPILGAAVGQGGLDHHVAGQVLILGAEPVEGPGTHAGPDEGAGAGEGLQQRRAVVNAFANHRTHHAKIVDAFADIRKQVRDRDAALAAVLKRPRRLHQRTGRRIGKSEGALHG